MSRGKMGLRFRVFQRDGFRCRYCGRSSTEEGVVLHADHVWPKSKGGPDTMDNLVTACRECNLGKHDVLLEGLTKPEPVEVPRRFGKTHPHSLQGDYFTDEQLAIIARVQNRGRAA